MAGWHQAQDLGLWGAVLGGLIATYFTFMPCFFWIFLGAPYMEQIRGNRFLSGALAAITAGVVGVVLNLAVWFGLNVLFPASKASIGLPWEWQPSPSSPCSVQAGHHPGGGRRRRPRVDVSAVILSLPPPDQAMKLSSNLLIFLLFIGRYLHEEKLKDNF